MLLYEVNLGILYGCYALCDSLVIVRHNPMLDNMVFIQHEQLHCLA